MKNSTFFMVFCLAAFSSAIMLYVTGLELTTLTNLLFIIIPQGYLPCAELKLLSPEIDFYNFVTRFQRALCKSLSQYFRVAVFSERG